MVRATEEEIVAALAKVQKELDENASSSSEEVDDDDMTQAEEESEEESEEEPPVRSRAAKSKVGTIYTAFFLLAQRPTPASVQVES